MPIFDFKVSKIKNEKDSLHINTTSKRNRVRASLALYKYRDKDTRQIVFYIPSLQLTSYGADEKKAFEMIKFSMDDYFQFITNLSAKKIEVELLSLGWKRNTLKNKDYSSVYIDIKGELKNFNAVGDNVERLTLVA